MVVGDDYGTPVYGWGDPEPVQVRAWAAPRTREPKLAGHDRLVVDVEVYADEPLVHHRDKMILAAELGDDDPVYLVEGEPEDYTHGPWGGGGYVINLRRVEG